MAITCCVVGCELSVSAKGFCKKHYAADRRKKKAKEMRIYGRVHYLKNKDKIRKQQRDRYATGGGREKMAVYLEKNKEVIRRKNFEKRRPRDLDGWAKCVRLKTCVNASARKSRGKPSGGAVSLDLLRGMIADALERGDVSLDNPITAPSPDRIDCLSGYSDDNVQIVPLWLNYAYRHWAKSDVDDAILAWAKRKLRV